MYDGALRGLMTESADDVDLALLAEMVETVGVGVAIYDGTGRFQYVNDAYADILDADRETLSGTPIWEVVAGFEPEGFRAYWDSFETGETRADEAEHEFDGTAVPVGTITTRRRIDGTPYNFGTIRDITERKRRERELKEKNERLEAFAGIVSHDLRNPLGVAKGYLDLLKGDVDRDELELIESALERMDILIEDLLSLARKGRAVENPESVGIAEVAADAWQHVEAPDSTLETADRTVRADPKRLQQLFENLFRNAIEHADPPVALRVGPLDDVPGFYVEDDGPGIPEHERERVFEPNYSTEEDGTGFGLAIVEEIATAHEWRISIVDGSDGGARFEFSTDTEE